MVVGGLRVLEMSGDEKKEEISGAVEDCRY